MARENAFKVEGRVVEALSARTYRVELANGHRLLGFVVGRDATQCAPMQVGHTVSLQLSPYDLSQGRIIVEKRKI
jgi:translation initiation factor IF-1